MTYRDLIGRIRLILIEPSPMRPSESFVFEHLKQNAQLLFNQAIMAPPNWCLQYKDLTVSDGEDIYLLTAQNFGKDVLVHTIDDSDPNHLERPIRRMSLQSSGIGGAESYAYTGNFTQRGIKHSAQTMVIWREAGGAIKVKVIPEPTETATYRFWYENGEPNTDSLGNEFAIPQATSLLCVRTAFDCLPGTDWCGYTKAENAEKRKELALTLGNSVKEHQREYRRWIATDRKPGRVLNRGFQDDLYSNRGWW